MKSMQQM